jgi:hypothetical protein
MTPALPGRGGQVAVKVQVLALRHMAFAPQPLAGSGVVKPCATVKHPGRIRSGKRSTQRLSGDKRICHGVLLVKT